MVSDRESRTAPTSRAQLRATEGLSASLLQDREEVLRWKDENPLRLVAAAILDVPRNEMKVGRATKKSIGEQLVPAVLDTPREWENLWDKIRPALGDSPHFDYDSENPRNGIRRRSNPSDIPPVSLSEIAPPARTNRGDKTAPSPSDSASRPPGLRVVEWINWAQSERDVSAPRGIPPEGLAAYLRQQPAAVIPTTIGKLSGAIVEKIINATPSSRPSPGAWIDLLAASLDRWAELPDDGRVSALEIIRFYARLTESLGEGVCQNLVKSLANYTSANADNAGVMASAMLMNSSDSSSATTPILEKIHALLGEPARIILWRNLITSHSGQISGWLNNRWRNIPSAVEKSKVATSLLMASRDDDLIGKVDSLLSGAWDFADAAEERRHLFNPILLGYLTRRALTPQCGRVLRDIAERVGENGAAQPESAAGSLMPAFEWLIDVGAKDKLKRQSDDYENKLAIERGRLRDAEGELERTTTHLEFLQSENRTKRTVAILEVTRDAIIVLGDALQGLATSGVPKTREVGNLESKIVLALSTLNARTFGEVGEVAPFDPEIHQADQPPEISTPVKIVAPGLRYSRGTNVSVTVVPMKVHQEA